MLERERAIMEERKSHLSLVIHQRRGLVDRIGTGKVQIGTSIETTLRIGRMRKKVREHTSKLETRLAPVEDELKALSSIEEARTYLSHVEKMKSQLTELSDLAAEGVLKPEELAMHQKEYEALRDLPSQNSSLRRAIERIAEAGKNEGILQKKKEFIKTEPQEKVKERRGKTRGQKDKRPVTFELPSGRELRGKEGLLIKTLLEREEQRERKISANQLAKQIYVGLSHKEARRRVNSVAHSVKNYLREENLDILVLRDFRKGITYYSLRRLEVKPKQETIETATQQAKTEEEMTEVAGLSKANITTIAVTLRSYKEELSPFLKARGISYIDASILQELEALGENEEVFKHIRKLSAENVQEERAELLKNLRLHSFEKARKIIKSSDLERILEDAHQKNPNLWALLFNLYEINEVIESLRQKEGISFIEEMITLPRQMEYIVEKGGNITLVGRQDSTKAVGEPIPPQPQSTPVEQISSNSPSSISSIVSPGEKSTGVVGAALDVVGRALEIVITKREVKRGVEHEDPKIRARLHGYFEEIEKRSEFKQPANPASVNRVFQRLKQTVVEKFLYDKLIPVIKLGGDRYVFNHTAIATALYLYDHGRDMNSRHKKQVQEIAAEVFAGRQRRNGNSKSINGR